MSFLKLSKSLITVFFEIFICIELFDLAYLSLQVCFIIPRSFYIFLKEAMFSMMSFALVKCLQIARRKLRQNYPRTITNEKVFFYYTRILNIYFKKRKLSNIRITLTYCTLTPLSISLSLFFSFFSHSLSLGLLLFARFFDIMFILFVAFLY